MLKSKITPWAVALFAIAALLCGFLYWRNAPDTIKLAGAIGAVLVSFLSAVLASGTDDDKSGPASFLLFVGAGAIAAATLAPVAGCTPDARRVAIADSIKLAACAAAECGDAPDPAAFGVCMATRCAPRIPPSDVIKLFESTQGLKSAAAGALAAMDAGAPSDAGKDGAR